MHPVVRLIVLSGLASALSFAESWSGMLVNSTCYQSEENNHNASDTSVNSDKDLAIRICSPTARTKSFAVVEPDGLSFTLDPTGNAKAATLVPKTRKRSLMAVTVTGEMNKETVKVESISRQK